MTIHSTGQNDFISKKSKEKGYSAVWIGLERNGNGNIITIDVKFASGIKNINFGLYPYTPMCVSTVYSVLT